MASINLKDSFRDIIFPKSSQYSSDSNHIPLEFYEGAIPRATNIEMVLGYFSSNAIRTLCMSFAEFIYKGGSMKLVTNHELTEEDKVNLLIDTSINNENHVIDIFKDIEVLREELGPFGQHFFDCLKYLINQGRLSLQPVMHNPTAISHYKKIIMYDGVEYLYVHGSANFTGAGVIKNGESFTVDKTWGSETEIFRIREEIENFKLIFEKKHSSYQYLNPEEVTGIINKIGNTLTEIELLERSLDLRELEGGSDLVKQINQKSENDFRAKIEKIKNTPKFPFGSSARPYQVEAYKNWEANNYSGVFAMATGTGKTITALNCALMEYEKSLEYFIIILVPSKALLYQWEEEVKSFNFNNILKVGAGNNWIGDLSNYTSNYKYDIKSSLVIIAINDSFTLPKFQKYFKIIQKSFLFIADEAHNLGSSQMRAALLKINPDKRIGLSATPKRIYDPEGTKFINEFFRDKEPYVYSFTMERALAEGRLTNYYYYPKIVTLEILEQEEYNSISKQLLKFFDFEKGIFKDNPMVEILLLQRKRIIHKAAQKQNCFINIIKQLKIEDKLRYVFTYVPEGLSTEDDNYGEKLIYQYIKSAHEVSNKLRLSSYTSSDSGHKDLLKAFSNGEIDIIFAMKMLDEGIDVPRTEIGIFASSTGNPRQYIQRRGRLLRTHKDKLFSTIYDMVVVPMPSGDPSLYNIERNLLKAELIRVAYFASLAMNFKDAKRELSDVSSQYDLDLDTLILELE